jgi:hypothetical protein
MWIQVVLLGVMLGQAPPAPQARSDAALLDAARLGDVARAKALIAAGADVHAVDYRGFTPLLWACAGAPPELVRLLLESGASPDPRAGDGTTALMLAAANGLTETARLLLSRGADATATKEGMTARQLAADRGHLEVATLLEQAETLALRLIQAASDGQAVLVRQLTALGAPVNARNARGVSPLMLAARTGDLGLLHFLLARGADMSVRDANGETVFDWAEKSPATAKYVRAFLADRPVKRAMSAAPASPEVPDVSASLRALEAALARAAAESRPSRAVYQRAGTALSGLLKLSTRWPASSPENYRISLAADVRSLGAAIDSQDTARLNTTLESLAEDLEAKLEHCLASGGKLGGAVVVRVRTVQGGQESESWQVFYMPKVFEASPTASPDLFPQLSSPTDERLVPGRYLMWLRNPGTGAVGERTVVKVGEGRQELMIDLPVPGGAPK